MVRRVFCESCTIWITASASASQNWPSTSTASSAPVISTEFTAGPMGSDVYISISSPALPPPPPPPPPVPVSVVVSVVVVPVVVPVLVPVSSSPSQASMARGRLRVRLRAMILRVMGGLARGVERSGADPKVADFPWPMS